MGKEFCGGRYRYNIILAGVCGVIDNSFRGVGGGRARCNYRTIKVDVMPCHK